MTRRAAVIAALMPMAWLKSKTVNRIQLDLGGVLGMDELVVVWQGEKTAS